MTGSEKEFFLKHYLSMDNDEFSRVCLRAAENPHSIRPSASLALLEAAERRGITFAESVANALVDREADKRLSKAFADDREQKKNRHMRDQDQSMGWIGLVVALFILFASLDAQHTGGAIAGVVTLGCSLWILYSSRK